MRPFAIALLLVSTGLMGCATPGGYDWGAYDQMLYQSYKDPSMKEAARLGIEKHIAVLEASGRRVPPGLYAELGTFYLEMGETDSAIALYGKERDSWPESEHLMNAMITRLDRRRSTRLEVVQ